MTLQHRSHFVIPMSRSPERSRRGAAVSAEATRDQREAFSFWRGKDESLRVDLRMTDKRVQEADR
jgi:hypothetical protein